MAGGWPQPIAGSLTRPANPPSSDGFRDFWAILTGWFPSQVVDFPLIESEKRKYRQTPIYADD